MNKKNLTERLADFGFPMLEAAEEADANLTLADLVKSHDLRLWEGFPVVLAFSAEAGKFDYKKSETKLSGNPDHLYFGLLAAMSLALYRALGLKFSWAAKLYAMLNAEGKRQFGNYLHAFKSGDDLRLQHRVMSVQRLKATFNNYFRKREANLRDSYEEWKGFGLEQALSQVFSPKQKELFLKRLKNEKLTKTESEYFSRAVKKKAAALANSELHHLAQKVVK